MENRGGKRENSGRKKATNPKVKVWFSVVKSEAQTFRDKVEPILEKLNKKGQHRNAARTKTKTTL